MSSKFVDSTGKSLPYTDVRRLAFNQVLGMSKADLAEYYVDNLAEDELIDWATDDDGEFQVERREEL